MKLKPIGNIILVKGEEEVSKNIATKLTLHDSSIISIRYEDYINDKLSETWNKFVTKVHYYLTHMDVILVSGEWDESKLWEELGKKPKYIIDISEG